MINGPKNLTEFELIGMQSLYNMADGHAYHDLTREQNEIVQKAPELWSRASAKKIRQAECDFRDTFLGLAQSPSLKNFENFRICPTASNTIDIIGAWLRDKKMTAALLEPTFDNLALILRRREVPIKAYTEQLFTLEDLDFVFKPIGNFDALFIINPNNPTGKVLTKERFKEIADWCFENKKTLVADLSFRFFVPQTYDQHQVLIESGVSFITFEDTGKTWPTLDMKASLVCFSDDVADKFNEIYDEIYLCVSNFQLEIIGEFLNDSFERGLDETLHKEVRERRNAFRNAIEGSVLQIQPEAINSNLSVEWVGIEDNFLNDYEMVTLLQKLGISALPGRNFYWDSHGTKLSVHTIRFAMMKPKKKFTAALEVLKGALDQINKSR